LTNNSTLGAACPLLRVFVTSDEEVQTEAEDDHQDEDQHLQLDLTFQPELLIEADGLSWARHTSLTARRFLDAKER
jgi:hypothetical protein